MLLLLRTAAVVELGSGGGTAVLVRFPAAGGASTLLLPVKIRIKIKFTSKHTFRGKNMELNFQSLFGLYSLADTPQIYPSSPRIWAHIRGRYWSDKIDDISL